MKQVILSLVAVCALTTAFAQNSATLNQNGTGNSSNSAQAGNFQTVEVVQNGTGNVNINQQFSTYSQLASITQTGLANTANTFQNANAGPLNVITINQNGTGTGGNLVVVNQSDFWTINAQAIISQNGQLNTANVQQIGSVNDIAIIDQQGSSQTATINQGNGLGSVSSTNNYAYIQQLSSFGPQNATITQLGENNNAQIYQNDNAGPGNNSVISQVGNNNVALVDQSDFQTVSTSGYISQTGNNNTAVLEQKGVTGNFTNGSIAYIIQDGNNNVARFHQDGGASNGAAIVQTGDYNVLEYLSGPGSFALQNGGGFNTLLVSQTSLPGSSGQVAQVEQVGAFNYGSINQSN